MVLAGAGLSAGSGVPTFRSPNGAWAIGEDLRQALQIGHYMTRPKARKVVWDWIHGFYEMDPEPSIAHEALARLAKAGGLIGVLTQNVDGLEARAGVPVDKVWTLHGGLDYAYCQRCYAKTPVLEILGTLYGMDGAGDPAEWVYDGLHTVPQVDKQVLSCHEWSERKGKPCGGVLKPGIVFYGEDVRREAWSNAVHALQYLDELWVVGTSLNVWPAADLPKMAITIGKTVKVVDPSPSAVIDGVPRDSWTKITATADEALPSMVDDLIAN